MAEFRSISPELLRAMAEKNLSEQDLWSNQEFSSREWRLRAVSLRRGVPCMVL